MTHRTRIMLDLGANHGEKTLEQLVRQERIYMFEANPVLFQLLREITRDHSHIKLIDKAVWTEDTNLELYLSKQYDTGSTVMPDKKFNKPDYEHPIVVEAIDFSAWVAKNIDREIHKVYMKMDIEGAEFAVLEKMIEEGTLDHIERFFIEFHSDKFEYERERHKKILKYFRGKNVDITDRYLISKDLP